MRNSVLSFVLIGQLALVPAHAVAKGQSAQRPYSKQIATIPNQNSTLVLREIAEALNGKTKVPVRWPTVVPDATDATQPLYVNLVSVSNSGYQIEIAWTPDCTGGNNCHYGTVRGSSEPLPQNAGARVLVELAGGIKGYFIDAECDAHCDESTINWVQHDYHYSIGIKAEKKQKLIKCANSAILSSSPESNPK